jgi:hypothetical protein
VLGCAGPELIDTVNSVDVELVDAEQWLTSSDDEGLCAGMNLAMLGNELLQFADVAPLGGGRFRLSRLLRGRAGTEWASGAHAAGEPFSLIQANTVQNVPLPASAIGSTVTAADRAGASISIVVTGESVRPWTPIDLVPAFDAEGDLTLSWTRRSRAGSFWLDEVDVAIGESREQYRVTVIGPAASAEYTVGEPTLTIGAAELEALGSGPAGVEVRQIGDFAASRPAQVSINLP